MISAQLYHFIQRAAQQAERLHSELHQKCEQQSQQIIMLTEQREQLTLENGKLQNQMDEMASVFREVWPAVMAHYSHIPVNV